MQDIRKLITIRNGLKQQDDTNIDTLFEGLRDLRRIDSIIEQLNNILGKVKKEVNDLSLKRSDPLVLARKISELEERSRGYLEEIQDLIGNKEEGAKTKELKGFAEKFLIEKERKKTDSEV